MQKSLIQKEHAYQHRKIAAVKREGKTSCLQIINDTVFDDYFYRKRPLLTDTQHNAANIYHEYYYQGAHKLNTKRVGTSFIMPSLASGRRFDSIADYQTDCYLKYRDAGRRLEAEGRRLLEDMCDGYQASDLERKYKLPKSYVLRRLISVLDTLAVHFGLQTAP